MTNKIPLKTSTVLNLELVLPNFFSLDGLLCNGEKCEEQVSSDLAESSDKSIRSLVPHCLLHIEAMPLAVHGPASKLPNLSGAPLPLVWL